MPDALTLSLPEPPSANRWWRHVGAKVLLSREARAYKQSTALLVIAEGARVIPAPTPVAITVTWCRARKSGDLDKRLGVLLDALQGAAYDNDSQIVEIVARRRDTPGWGRVLVTIEATENPRVLLDPARASTRQVLDHLHPFPSLTPL